MLTNHSEPTELKDKDEFIKPTKEKEREPIWYTLILIVNFFQPNKMVF